MKTKLFAAALAAMALLYVAVFQQEPAENDPAGVTRLAVDNTGSDDSSPPPPANHRQEALKPDLRTFSLPASPPDQLEATVDGEPVTAINERWDEFNLGTILSPMEPSKISHKLSETEWGSYQEARDTLARFFDDPEQYPRIVAYFLTVCYALEMSSYYYEPRRSQSKKYFDDARRKHCAEYDKIDPFWIILERARSGDNLAKLQLMYELRAAIRRQEISPRKEPLEYMHIRDEIVSMYEQMARAGVGAAAYELYITHLSKSPYVILPENLLMAYYYGLLSRKNGFGGGPAESTLQYDILDKMSEADRETAEAIRREIKNR